MSRLMSLFLAVPLAAAPQPTVVSTDAPQPEVSSASPAFSQGKIFVLSDQATLDPQTYRVDLAFLSVPTDDPNQSVAQLEVELGLSRHVELHLAQDATDLSFASGLLQGGTELGVRYALADGYGGIQGNPTLELDWHPRQGDPASVGGKLSTSGELRHGLLGVANLRVDENVVGRNGNGTGELGVSMGASQEVVSDHLRVGAEMDLSVIQTGWFQTGSGPGNQASVKLGPNAMAKMGPVSITGAVLFDAAQPQVKVDPYVIVGLPF